MAAFVQKHVIVRLTLQQNQTMFFEVESDEILEPFVFG